MPPFGRACKPDPQEADTMPSPFPGMDPFIENQAWADFRHGMIDEIRAALVPLVRPRYTVSIEERVYIEHETGERAAHIRPDVTLLGHETRESYVTAQAGSPIVMTLPPPISEPERENYLVVRERESMRVVTVIEVLSPANKRKGSDGRHEYLNKRDEVLSSPAHLVELDLLRGGEHLPTVEPLPEADYFAFVSRAQRRPQIEVYAWSLRAKLPVILIPLEKDDPDFKLDLQDTFSRVYDRAGYDYSLDYQREIQPPLGEPDAAWVKEHLQTKPT